MAHPSGAIRVEFLGQVLAHDPGTQKSLTHTGASIGKFEYWGFLDDLWMGFFFSVLVGDFWKFDLETKHRRFFDVVFFLGGTLTGSQQKNGRMTGDA